MRGKFCKVSEQSWDLDVGKGVVLASEANQSVDGFGVHYTLWCT